jgi:hypothetical protein
MRELWHPAAASAISDMATRPVLENVILKPPPDFRAPSDQFSCPTTKMEMVAKFQPYMVKIPFAAESVAKISHLNVGGALQPPMARLGTNT